MWWPQLTVDVLRGDLRRLEHPVDTPIGRADDDDENIVSDWVWVGGGNSLSPPPSIKETGEMCVLSLSSRIDLVRFRICMGTFEAFALAAGLGEALGESFSPLDFCKERDSPGKNSVICVDVTPMLADHLLDREWTDAGVKQDAKDIARDAVVINGGPVIKGAEEGYEGILDRMKPEIFASAAKTVLSVACRTFSGGCVFEQVLKFFPDHLVAPVSRDAAPLDIVLIPGRAVIRAHTRYSLQEDQGAGLMTYLNGYCFAELVTGDLSKSRAFVFLVEE